MRQFRKIMIFVLDRRNEFTFRLNEDNCEIDTLDKIDSTIGNMQNKKIGYKEL